tara:strand:+ start:5475 stop:5702 length:228 start_codon:yes stop_codon:yes gene_type:complete
MTNLQKIEKQLEPIFLVLNEVLLEVDAIGGDWDSLDDQEREQLSKDIKAFEEHLRKSANCLTHLKGSNYPDWGKK